MNYAYFRTELDKISRSTENLEEQGYLSAHLICDYTGASPKTLMETLTEALQEPDRRPGFVDRDLGALRWCKEQVEKDGGVLCRGGWEGSNGK